MNTGSSSPEKLPRPLGEMSEEEVDALATQYIPSRNHPTEIDEHGRTMLIINPKGHEALAALLEKISTQKG